MSRIKILIIIITVFFLFTACVQNEDIESAPENFEAKPEIEINAQEESQTNTTSKEEMNGPYDVTIYVDAGYYPLTYNEYGVAKGIYVDFLKIAFSRMENFNVTIEAVPWQRGKTLLQTGEGFALAPPFYHGHDWEYIYPYSIQFNTENIVAITLANDNTPDTLKWPEEYLGTVVGNVAGFDGYGGEEFRKLVAEGKINLDETENVFTHIQKLVNHRVDYIMMNDAIFEYQVKKMRDESELDNLVQFKITSIIGSDPVYLGYSENYNAPYEYEFRKAFDNEVYKMIKSGEIEEIMNAFEE